jgi:hypothetical protein
MQVMTLSKMMEEQEDLVAMACIQVGTLIRMGKEQEDLVVRVRIVSS